MTDKQDLNPFYDAIERIRRNDDGSASALGELQKMLPDFTYAVFCEANYRRQQEWGKEK